MSGGKNLNNKKKKYIQIKKVSVGVEGREGYLHRSHRAIKKAKPSELDLEKRKKLNIIKEEEALDEMKLYSK